MTERKHTCTVRDGKFVEPCDTLGERIASHAAYAMRGSGFFHMTLTDISTGQPSRSMIGYRTPKSPKGLLVNFCPWCGGKIDAPFADEPKDSPT